MAGIIVQSRPMRSRRGARWAILTLQDRTGVIEALVFPEAFQKLEPILKAATPLLVKARVAVEDVGTRLIVSDARVLDQVADRPASLLRVRVNRGAIDAGVLDRLGELFSSRPGRCRVAFELINEDGSEATIESRARSVPTTTWSSAFAKSAAPIPLRWCNERQASEGGA